MELAEYRNRKGLTLEAIAQLVGMSNASAVRKHETGQVMPRPETIEAYRQITDGEVTAEDFVRVAIRYRNANRQPKAA